MSGAAKDGMILANALRAPENVATLDAAEWTRLLTIARAELLIGTLAFRTQGLSIPDAPSAILSDARTNAEYQRRSALWEADCAARALASYDGCVTLMKGTAYVAASLRAGIGRSIGDLDIMVAEDDLPVVEKKLLAAGWEWVKEDAYDDAYYREHMHELPPLIHKERDRMIDVHHTILPKTAGPTPDPSAMLDDSIACSAYNGAEGLSIFAPTDMLIHCATHLIADGELDGGLRNLWDFHCLFGEFSAEHADFEAQLLMRAKHHQLHLAVERALRLADHLYGPQSRDLTATDRLFIRRMTARDGYGRGTRKFTRLAFYIRSHLLRMPPMMLARHLWTKWRKGS